MPRVFIDGREIDVAPGSNVLAAARKLGIDVPALCYHPGCEPNTACMVCVMKVKGSGRIVPACATKAEDGVEFESETEEVRALRRAALELLLSDHPGAKRGTHGNGLTSLGPATTHATADSRFDDCDQPGLACDCDKKPYCRLRKYAQAYGADPQRFAGAARELPERRYEHADITFDPRKCIVCGICVALAKQAGESVGLTVIGRGFDVRVDTPMNADLSESLRTIARRVAGACPTGALTPKSRQSAGNGTAPGTE